jgi:hypothetical protein|tara:strand:- start:962 stop:1204 length:243 start_codon:yes stop_codon:yes gene_type:complete
MAPSKATRETLFIIVGVIAMMLGIGTILTVAKDVSDRLHRDGKTNAEISQDNIKRCAEMGGAIKLDSRFMFNSCIIGKKR